MISATQIRKAFKSAVFDPKNRDTEFHIAARDMHAMAHIQRAKILITYFIEGVKGPEALPHALWHLAVAIAKNSEEKDHGPL